MSSTKVKERGSIGVLTFTDTRGESDVKQRMVAIFREKDFNENEVLAMLKSGEASDNTRIGILLEETFLYLFKDFLPEDAFGKRDEEPETSLKRPKVGEHVWAVVNGLDFRLHIIPAVIQFVDNRIIVFISEADAKKPRGFSVSTYAVPRKKWLKSIFPDRAMAEASLLSANRRDRYDPV